VLLIRSGLEGGRSHTTTPTVSTTRGAATTVGGTKRRPGARRFYTVQRGDTFGSIAAKAGTSVARLVQLNPGVNPNSLQVGQRLRVQ
jgi:LysM repeat protein